MIDRNVERTGKRNLFFSRWHRTLPTPARFIDIDYLEFCPHCKQPLIVGETAWFKGVFYKNTTLTTNIGLLFRKAGVPVVILTIFYVPKGEDIEKFYVRKYSHTWGDYVETSPEKFRECVLGVHERHERECPMLRRNYLGTKEGKDKSPAQSALA
jgi:hypothetical protein